MRRVRAEFVLNMKEVVGDLHVYTRVAGPHGDLIIVGSAEEPVYRRDDGVLMNEFDHFTLFHYLHWGITELELPPLAGGYGYLQPLTGGRWLSVIGDRKLPNGDNAQILDRDGQVVHTFWVGTGVEEVGVTTDDQIWISYADYSRFDRDHWPVGLIRFDERGQPLFRYNDLTGSILHCYALNVAAKNEVWIYHYPGFPLERLKGDRVDRRWSDFPIKYGRTFAVFDHWALFVGKYQTVDGIYLIELERLKVEEMVVLDADGKPLGWQFAWGRGSRLYLSTESDDIYLLELRELVR